MLGPSYPAGFDSPPGLHSVTPSLRHFLTSPSLSPSHDLCLKARAELSETMPQEARPDMTSRPHKLQITEALPNEPPELPESQPAGGSLDAEEVTAPAPLPFERRICDRWPSRGLVIAYGAAGEHFGRRYALRMLDASDDGIGVQSDRPLDPGTVVSIAFAAPGHPVRSGVVVRCLPCGDGYRVAIRFELRMAA